MSTFYSKDKSHFITVLNGIAFRLEHPGERKNNSEDIEKQEIKKDDRLFPEYLLYCEGMHRPTYRGFLHFLCAAVMPFGIFHLFYEASDSNVGKAAAIFYSLSAFSCYFTSSLYHMGRWSLRTEILLQKLDHCSIAFYACGTNIPTAFLLLPFHIGFALGFLSIASMSITCFSILFRNKSSVWKLVSVASCIALFWPILYFKMNYIEFTCMISNAAVAALGAAIFVNKYPDPLPNIFGYHEVFHVCTVFTLLFTYLCNWSVIHRTCNPYSTYTDIFELMFQYAKDQSY